jgi:hypothetical protein
VVGKNGISESFSGAGMSFWILVLGGVGMAVGIGLPGGRVMTPLVAALVTIGVFALLRWLVPIPGLP